jgi:hypothetical protein
VHLNLTGRFNYDTRIMKNVLKSHMHKLDPIDMEGVMLFNIHPAVN